MPLSARPRPRNENHLLARLPQADYRRLLSQAEVVRLEPRHVLHRAGSPITHVYWPRSGVLSLLATMGDQSEIEVASVGREGVLGVSACWGAATWRSACVVQLPGEAVTIPVPALCSQLERSGPLFDMLARSLVACLTQAMQTAACHGLHSVRQRCCRWLLAARDRSESEQFPLTQDALAHLLGVRRAGVAEVARQLHQAGSIRYQRGVITIRDRTSLQSAACECYEVIRDAWKW